MRETLFHLERDRSKSLQTQVRELLVAAILSGQVPANAPVPSTRIMAQQLKVSRNTVMLAYQHLIEDRYLVSRERSGFYVSAEIGDRIDSAPPTRSPGSRVDWSRRLRVAPAGQQNIHKPDNWHEYPYPFIYGQVDPSLFPITAWRDCLRQAMGRRWLDAWTDDLFVADDPMLIEQIRQRLLPRRGISANEDEILVTVGAQNALYLLASLLVKPGTVVGLEDPGYPDIRNIFALRAGHVRPIDVDAEGLVVDGRLDGCHLVFVTPSHQAPTTVTMSAGRRRALLDWAERGDALVIEDDYEFETNFEGAETPALASLDGGGRVIYVGSLSKSLMPGLRIGYLVASAPLIVQARALRRLMLRHPPGNNQRVAALFLALGHHDVLLGRLRRAYRERRLALGQALARHLPGWSCMPNRGGSAHWVRGPDGLDANRLARSALNEGVVIEPGDIYFTDQAAHRNTFRLGYASLPTANIEPGIVRLAAVAATVWNKA